MDALPASLLGVGWSRGRSVVTRARSVAPLRLLTPVSPGTAAWVYQASLGGGFVGGDAIALDVAVEPGARLFLTTQASSKAYRGAASTSRLDVRVADGGVVVAWPDPIVCFAGAALDQRQRFALTGDAGVIAVDAWTAGRVARGERWAFDRLALATEVAIDGAAVLTDAIVVAPAHGALGPRMAHAEAFATVVVAGEAVRAGAAAIAREVATRPLRPPGGGALVSASAWPWGTVVRVAAGSTRALAAELGSLIGGLVAATLGADPFARKW